MSYLHPNILLSILFIFGVICCSPEQEITKEDMDRYDDALSLESDSLNPQLAYEKYEENAEIFQKKSSDSPLYLELTARSLRNAGNCLSDLGLLPDAAEQYEEAIILYDGVVTNDLGHFSPEDIDTTYKRVGSLYYNYSIVALQLGDIKKAKNLNHQAAKWYEKTDHCKSKVRYKNHDANILHDEFKYEAGINRAKQALATFESCGDLPSNLKADVLHTIAYGYEWLEQYDVAIDKYSEALEYTKDDLDSAKTLLNIGFVFIKKDEFKKAKDYLSQSLEIRKDIASQAETDFLYPVVYEHFGDMAMQEKDYETALNQYQIALMNLTDEFRNQDTNTTPEVNDNLYIYNKPDLLRILDLKAQAALASGKLDLAHATYQVLDKWISEFYKDITTNESKLTWIERVRTTYDNAIEVALLKKEHQKAFEYAEKAHAVLLWQSLSHQAAQNLLSVAEKDELRDISAQIRQADIEYRYGEIPIEEVRALERDRDALEREFSKKSQYKQRKYQAESTTVKDVQEKIIDDNTAFIEYYRTDSVLYIFTITKNGFEITQKSADGLADDISDFIENISSRRSGENSKGIENYHVLAYKIYERLIPKNIQLNEEINRLVIVADREIGTLPFAALSTKASTSDKFDDSVFLVQRYITNYLYSAGSYLQLQQRKTDQTRSFAGIAPIDYQLEGWAKLRDSNEEINEIKKIYAGHRKILKRRKATKAGFERIVQEGYHTIQISTHAVFDENGARIIFYNDSLNQDEIDRLEINTHRLILSACQTGAGIQNKGEGILSLGWNFAYKGVPSITMTHWTIDDYFTKEIMISYHQHLNDSVPADQALQKAQIEHLNDGVTSRSQYSPYYWAAFFHTGNTK